MAFINRSIYLGESIVNLPFSYEFMSKFPNFSYYACKVTQLYALIYNGIYNLLYQDAHTKFVASKQATPEKMAKEYRAYKSGAVSDWLAGEERIMFCMKERDALYAETLASQSENWLAVVGYLHFTGEHGLVSLLEKKGFTLEPVSIYDMAMNSDPQAAQNDADK